MFFSPEKGRLIIIVHSHALEESQVELLKELHGREVNESDLKCIHLKVTYVTPFATIWKLQDLE